MDFIDDINAVVPPERREFDVLADLPDIIDTGIRGAVDLDHVYGLPWAISVQFGQVLHGLPVGPCSQLRALAKIRATVVFPTPRVPENKNA